jgi:septal ring factor EnvC (AmiA/AmiB activator)
MAPAPRSWIALRAAAAAIALALPVTACASQPDPQATASPASIGQLQEQIAAVDSEIAQERTKIAAMLSETREDGGALSEDPGFRALADHLVELELRLEALESERSALEAGPSADLEDGAPHE